MEIMANKNQSNKRSYSFIALIFAGLAFISTALFLITKGLLAVGMFSGATTDTLNRGLLLSIGFTILALAVYVVLEPEKTRQALTGRQARYGSNALIMSIAFLGILIVGNVLTFQNPKRVDLTEDQSHTLAPETIQALKTLPAPVSAVGYFSSTLPTNTADELLKNFKASSNGKFDYKFVNPDTDPVAAREAGITGDGKILLTMGDHKEIAGFASETELAKALIRLINPKPRAVYFLTGHGEASLTSGDVSVATAKTTLESKNYTVNSLNLLADNKVPEDALAIIIAGPMKQVSQPEVQLLKKYVDAGGSLIVMENPVLMTEFGTSSDPLADYLATDWGITLNNDVIIDLSGQQPLNAVSYSANQHPITQNMTQVVIMPQARSISITGAPEGVTQTPLIQTSPNSWGETKFTNAQGTQISEDPEDLPGPLTMAATGENTTTKGRVVVVGNSLFAEDKGFEAYGNGNFFINSVDWASEQEDLINITPHTPTARTFTPPSQIQLLVILLSSVIIIPGLVVFAGVSAWLARRRQG
jgi:gliding motility-associatede transport system auxiliary component